jgi:HD-GYP domain-containing protein (c-di-GMP phosphodiesterase class II)
MLDATSTASTEQQRLLTLVEIGRTLRSCDGLDACLCGIAELTSRMFGAERSSIFLYDASADELVSRVAEGLDESSEIRFPASKGLAGHVARTGETLNIPDAYEDARFNRESDKQTGFRTRAVLASPLYGYNHRVLGVLQVLNKVGGGRFETEDEQLLEAVAGQCAVVLDNASLVSELDQVFETFIDAASQAIDQRDPTTAGHSRRVTHYTLNLARAVHYSDAPAFRDRSYDRRTLRQLRYAGLLHDFGKIGVREAVLCKVNKLHPGFDQALENRVARAMEKRKTDFLLEAVKSGQVESESVRSRVQEMDAAIEELLSLIQAMNISGARIGGAIERLQALLDEGLLTQEEFDYLSITRGNLAEHEWEEMKSHASKSYQVLKRITWPEDLAEVPRIAHGHHEKLNGTGYPLGLSSEGIHFDSKVMCVADIYDALTCSDRPYKKAMPHDRAMSILREEVERGALDGDLVELFESAGCYNIKPEDECRSGIFDDEL